MVTFRHGNALRKHVKIRHPRSAAQKSNDRKSVKLYRRQMLLMFNRYGMPES